VMRLRCSVIIHHDCCCAKTTDVHPICLPAGDATSCHQRLYKQCCNMVANPRC
jgi:hypothetical protein